MESNKDGAEVFPTIVYKNKKVVHGKKWMPAMYVAYFGILKDVAAFHGYALCVHGSIERDFDLIAVPFDLKVSSHTELLQAIRVVVGCETSSDKLFDIVGHEPHGRTCYTIEAGGGGYFDISFTPTLQEAVKRAKQEIKNEAEIKELLKQSDNSQSK